MVGILSNLSWVRYSIASSVKTFSNFMEAGDESIDYAHFPDSAITPAIKDDAIKSKGYFIYPNQLFVNVAKDANSNPNLKYPNVSEA